MIPPGVVSVRVTRSEFATTRSLRYLVVVGNNKEVLRAPGATPDVCKTEVTISAAKRLGANGGETVQISCSRWVWPFHADGWIAFYCDPKDCQSESAEEAAMAAIAQDPDVLALARGNPDAGGPRGPYLVNIETGTK